jgi:hypothetical protein
VIGLIVAITGGVLLFMGLQSKGRLEIFNAAEPATIAEAIEAGDHPGPLLLTGKIGTSSPVTMAGKGEQVVYGSLQITATVRYRIDKTTKTDTQDLYDESWYAGDAFLEADGKRLPIDPAVFHKAEVTIPQRTDVADHKHASGIGFGARVGSVSYGNLKDLRIRSNLGRRSTTGRRPTIKVTKWVLAPGDEVFLFGGVQTRGDTVSIVAPGGDQLMLYAGKSPDAYAADLASQSGWMVPTGGGLLGLGLLMALGGVILLATR